MLFDRIYKDIERRRDRILSGKINCVPSPFQRFEEEWPGIEQRKYYGVTAQTKVGKTQLTDYVFLYHPFFYAFNNPDKIRLKIFYFSLEISAEEKFKLFLCHLLFILSKGKIRLSSKELNSVRAGKPLPKEILDILKTENYQKYYDFFEKNVEIISSIRHPTGIFKFMDNYAKANGTFHKKTINIVDNKTKQVTPTEVNDYYEPNDKDEYVIIIIDHISLISTESEHGRQLNLHESITKLSSTYLLDLRDNYSYIPVVVQQQALAGVGVENIKLGKLKPSSSDLGDNKLTARDMNVLFGLFSPFKHELRQYLGYNVEKLKDSLRFLEIIEGRDGGGGTVCPLYFDGAVNYFKELPLPNMLNDTHYDKLAARNVTVV